MLRPQFSLLHHHSHHGADDERDAVGLASDPMDFDTQAKQAASMITQSTQPSAQIQLSISCKDLGKLETGYLPDPFVVVSTRTSKCDDWCEIGRTEIITHDLNPKWVKLILIDYCFEAEQFLRFDVLNADTSYTSNDARLVDLERQINIGSAECVLAIIVKNRGSTWINPLTVLSQKQELQIKNIGSIIVRAEEIQDHNAVVTIELAAKGLKSACKKYFALNTANPFLRISRISEDGIAVPCYRTEVVMNTLSPVWAPISAPLSVLAAGNMHRPLLLEVWCWRKSGQHIQMGYAKASVNDLAEKMGAALLLVSLTNHPCGQLEVLKCFSENRPSFFDYIRGGMELSFICAIDFTGSNGDPSSRDSLHYVDPTQKPNEYAEAIIQIGNILEFYDSDKKFPCYGFGGKPTRGESVSHCFAVNGNEDDPEVIGVDGILEAYYASLQRVELFGPTLFAPVIKKASALAALTQSYDPMEQIYSILLILTDGIINDITNTTDAIVDASELPFSIIIVGIGGADFSSMEQLDGDLVRIRSSTGQPASRDIVQFVNLREVAGRGAQALAKEVLEEIPKSVVEYCTMRGIAPAKPPQPESFRPLNNLRDSLVMQHSQFIETQQQRRKSSSSSLSFSSISKTKSTSHFD